MRSDCTTGAFTTFSALGGGTGSGAAAGAAEPTTTGRADDRAHSRVPSTPSATPPSSAHSQLKDGPVTGAGATESAGGGELGGAGCACSALGWAYVTCPPPSSKTSSAQRPTASLADRLRVMKHLG
ncbi:hypothetical protein [Hymenobacter sp.]|uniref:hypothetical protein n=1 Tax=Hymenobacter sp. TaxID=1898978 RepID=UPI00286A4C2B|nr:hypothetical protein [Hymenobacter sp.]